MSKRSEQTASGIVEPFSGFLAGVLSTCVSHPLDIIKTRLQLQSQNRRSAFGDSFRVGRAILQEEKALRGLYRGLTPNLVGNATSWALYFFCYDKTKAFIRQYRSPHGELLFYDYFIASGAAGIFTSLSTNPIWVIKTRMLSTPSTHPGAYSSMLQGVRQIYRSEGISGFYRGLVPSLFGVTHGALQFMAYERLKIYRLGTHSATQQRDLNSADFLALSGLAKVFAGSATYPYQVVRSRLQMYDVDKIYNGARDVVIQIWKKEGLPGFYKGLGPNLLRVLPSTWVTFLVYERTRQYLSESLNEYEVGERR